MKNSILEMYRVKNRNRLINAFSDRFGYLSSIDIRTFLNDSFKNLIFRQRSENEDSRFSYSYSVKFKIYNNKKRFIVQNHSSHILVVEKYTLILFSNKFKCFQTTGANAVVPLIDIDGNISRLFSVTSVSFITIFFQKTTEMYP